MNRLLAAFACVILLNLTACKNHPSREGTMGYPWGDYEYHAYNLDGKQVATGRFHLAPIPDSREFVGRWDISRVGGANEADIGPQTGSGNLTGLRRRDALAIQLNPDMADNNVVLAGVLEGKRLDGTWDHSGFAGPMQRGTFRAWRVEAGTEYLKPELFRWACRDDDAGRD
jgi:hypothetical protein